MTHTDMYQHHFSDSCTIVTIVTKYSSYDNNNKSSQLTHDQMFYRHYVDSSTLSDPFSSHYQRNIFCQILIGINHTKI